MRYADSCCTYHETYNPHTYVFTGPCVVTKEMITVTIPAPELFAYRQGKKIQDAMPSLTDAEREFLMSGMSAEGWDKTFGVDDD